MEQLVLHKRFSSWHFVRLEQLLDDQSAAGYMLISATHKKQIFEPGGVPCRHRLGYCPARQNSAAYITYVAAQENTGWELVCQEQGWLYFRKPLAAFQADENQRLKEDRDGIRQLFTMVTKKLENWRAVELVLAAILIIAGYATTNLVLRLAVIPLVLVLINTYLIKFMSQSLEDDALMDR